ncbi:MAG: peptide deformylase, partial [Pseudomonadota bacterium]
RLFEDLWSTSVQHQMDHLGGRMYFDNLSRTKRAMLLKKHAKAKG